MDNGAVLSFGQNPLACGSAKHSTLESVVPLMIVYALFGFKRQLSCTVVFVNVDPSSMVWCSSVVASHCTLRLVTRGEYRKTLIPPKKENYQKKKGIGKQEVFLLLRKKYNFQLKSEIQGG